MRDNIYGAAKCPECGAPLFDGLCERCDEAALREGAERADQQRFEREQRLEALDLLAELVGGPLDAGAAPKFYWARKRKDSPRPVGKGLPVPPGYHIRLGALDQVDAANNGQTGAVAGVLGEVAGYINGRMLAYDKPGGVVAYMSEGEVAASWGLFPRQAVKAWAADHAIGQAVDDRLGLEHKPQNRARRRQSAVRRTEQRLREQQAARAHHEAGAARYRKFRARCDPDAIVARQQLADKLNEALMGRGER
jgi:hypothetical protein